MDLLTPDSGTLFWTVITFILLLLILKKYAWKPILKTLYDREIKIKDALDKADRDQKDAQKLLEEQRQLLEKARRESSQIIIESKKNADASRKELLEQARTEADRLLERAKHEIEHSKESAIEEIKQHTVNIALLAAQKVVEESLSPEKHLHLIEKYVKELNQPK